MRERLSLINIHVYGKNPEYVIEKLFAILCCAINEDYKIKFFTNFTLFYIILAVYDLTLENIIENSFLIKLLMGLILKNTLIP